MKKIFCSFLIGLVFLFSFPVSTFALSLYDPSNNINEFVHLSGNKSTGVSVNSNNFYFENNDTRSDYLYMSRVGTSSRIDLSGYNYLVVHFSNVSCSINCNQYIAAFYNTPIYILGDYGNIEHNNLTGTFDLVLDISELNGYFYIEFGFTTYPITGNSNAAYYNQFTGSYSGYVTSVELLTDLNNGGGESGEGGTVDLTTTNSLLSSISDTADDIAADIADIKTALGSLTTINTNVSDIKTSLAGFRSDVSTALGNINASIATAATSIVNAVTNGFSGLQTYLTGKYETLYNVILYGNKDGTIEEDSYDNLEAMEEDLDTLSQDMSDAAGLLHGANVNIAAYVTTFSEFYNGLGALGYGISGILTFGLFIILVKKVVGR